MPLPDDPFDAFDDWFSEASRTEPRVPEALQLCTVDADGRPRVRTVLLKDHGPDGFVFYTNLRSRKGRDLAGNPAVAAVWHWKSLERQVVIEGVAEPVSAQEADAYFASRPRGSRIGAWASDQSRPVADRAALDRAVAEAEARFAGHEVIPRPPHWSGFRIRPTHLEFWQGRADRLHDRLVYRLTADGWTQERWQP